ncbi:MAG: protein-disulfide reductase DsbD domain-containing protein [Aliishimia sp.]
MLTQTRPLCFALILVASPAFAQDPLDDALSHRVLTGWTQSDGTQMAAIELILAPGWKTYWRSPGDAGIPPQFTWQGARNLQDVQVHWPSPGIFWESGMRSVGYKNTVVLPLTVDPKREGEDIKLKGRMLLGICSDICVPITLDIDTTLPSLSSDRTPGIVAALANLPFSAQEAGVTDATCRIRPTENGLAVQADITMPSAGDTEDAVIEAPLPGVWVSEAKTERVGDQLTITAEMMQQTGEAFAINRSDIRITVIGGRHTVDIQGCTGS